MIPFTADAAFETASIRAADWSLCQVRLQDDGRFPWLILLPRRPGLVELEDLTPADQVMLTQEIIRAGHLVRALGRDTGRIVDKLNVAALGNVTAQLHVHVVGRRRDDPLWPDPIWGRGTPSPWPPEVRARLMATIADFGAG